MRLGERGQAAARSATGRQRVRLRGGGGGPAAGGRAAGGPGAGGPAAGGPGAGGPGAGGRRAGCRGRRAGGRRAGGRRADWSGAPTSVPGGTISSILSRMSSLSATAPGREPAHKLPLGCGQGWARSVPSAGAGLVSAASARRMTARRRRPARRQRFARTASWDESRDKSRYLELAAATTSAPCGSAPCGSAPCGSAPCGQPPVRAALYAQNRL